MFAILLSSLAVIATAYLGENYASYTTLFTSLVSLVKLMCTAYDPRISPFYAKDDAHLSLFLVLFTLTFNLLLLNLLTSIIIVHYLEYRRGMKELFRIRADLDRGRSFIQILVE
jgi:hypothetical protein